MFIRSERLFLRPAWPEDASDLHAAIGDERIIRNLAQVPWPYTIEDARDFVQRRPDRRFPSLLVTLPGDGGSRLIGGIGLHDEVGRPQLGYWVATEFWGHGYATEAVGALLGLVGTLGHGQVSACHFLDNPASGRVLEKFHFCQTGCVDHRYSRGRACPAPSREYALRLNDSVGCNEARTDGEPGMRAA